MPLVTRLGSGRPVATLVRTITKTTERTFLTAVVHCTGSAQGSSGKYRNSGTIEVLEIPRTLTVANGEVRESLLSRTTKAGAVDGAALLLFTNSGRYHPARWPVGIPSHHTKIQKLLPLEHTMSKHDSVSLSLLDCWSLRSPAVICIALPLRTMRADKTAQKAPAFAFISPFSLCP